MADFDVLVVGAGAAGLYAALCLPANLKVGLITKDTVSKSASDWAQGGIAAAIATNDSPLLHVDDTLKAGAGLCDRAAVELMTEQAEDCIAALINMGVAFDRSDGQLALTLEAAHSRRRVLHAADTTGRAIVAILGQQVLQRPNIQILNRAFALDLWMVNAGGDRQTPSKSQCCRGVIVLHNRTIRCLASRAVVLATGGGGQVFSNTTNPSLSTGDGVAMAWRAGALLRDLEFVQFHPTALAKTGAPRFLISEAVRGEGAHLVDDLGHRFAYEYHPAGELAPRDVVSRAITSHLSRSEESQVWLDLRPIPNERIQHRFPNIINVCRQWGVDPLTDMIPVSPAAHYWMGGIHTDLSSETSLGHVYAVGETASTGVHGANRLASNSLLECIVFGAQLAKLKLPSEPLPWDEASKSEAIAALAPPHRDGAPQAAERRAQLNEIRHQLPQLMWASAGIIRHQGALETALAQAIQWQAQLPLLSPLSLQPPSALGNGAVVSTADVQLWGETRNLLDIATLILKSAAFRQESRGGHYRSDFPAADSAWKAHTLVRADALWLEPSDIGDSVPAPAAVDVTTHRP
ncbi:MAG: L-aspartate oxidase [Elainellaceae cyanobacterium]